MHQVTKESTLGSAPLGLVASRVLANSDLKESTRQTYQRAIPVFVRWFEDSAEQHDAGTLIRFKRMLEARLDLGAATKSLYLNAARAFYRRLYELGALDRNLASGVRSFQTTTRHKKTPLSDVQLGSIYARLDVIRDTRLRLAIDLLYRQGLRRQEVVTLRVQDVDVAGGTLLVLGKGRDDREPVYLHPETLASINAYLEDTGIRDGYLFPSRKKPQEHITTTRLYQMVTDLHRDLGIPNALHAYRKAFTSKLIDAGMNLLTVQQFTRHKSLDMLKIYYDRIDQKRSLPLYVSALEA